MIDSVSDEGAGSTDLKRAKRIRRPQTTTANVDRLPPHSMEAEVGVLSCILIAPATNDKCECIESMKVGAEVFYDLRHQTIFSMLAGMDDLNGRD